MKRIKFQAAVPETNTVCKLSSNFIKANKTNSQLRVQSVTRLSISSKWLVVHYSNFGDLTNKIKNKFK